MAAETKGKYLVALTLLLVSAGGLMVGCVPSCSNDNLEQRSSPNGEYRAFSFTRNCGATTPLNAQISVGRDRENDEREGNVFIADGGGREKVSTPLDHVTLRWVNNRTLLISYDKRLRLFKQEKQIGPIHVDYMSL